MRVKVVHFFAGVLYQRARLYRVHLERCADAVSGPRQSDKHIS